MCVSVYTQLEWVNYKSDFRVFGIVFGIFRLGNIVLLYFEFCCSLNSTFQKFDFLFECLSDSRLIFGREPMGHPRKALIPSEFIEG